MSVCQVINSIYQSLPLQLRSSAVIETQFSKNDKTLDISFEKINEFYNSRTILYCTTSQLLLLCDNTIIFASNSFIEKNGFDPSGRFIQDLYSNFHIPELKKFDSNCVLFHDHNNGREKLKLRITQIPFSYQQEQLDSIILVEDYTDIHDLLMKYFVISNSCQLISNNLNYPLAITEISHYFDSELMTFSQGRAITTSFFIDFHGLNPQNIFKQIRLIISTELAKINNVYMEGLSQQFFTLIFPISSITQKDIVSSYQITRMIYWKIMDLMPEFKIYCSIAISNSQRLYLINDFPWKLTLFGKCTFLSSFMCFQTDGGSIVIGRDFFELLFRYNIIDEIDEKIFFKIMDYEEKTIHIINVKNI